MPLQERLGKFAKMTLPSIDSAHRNRLSCYILALLLSCLAGCSAPSQSPGQSPVKVTCPNGDWSISENFLASSSGFSESDRETFQAEMQFFFHEDCSLQYHELNLNPLAGRTEGRIEYEVVTSSPSAGFDAEMKRQGHAVKYPVLLTFERINGQWHCTAGEFKFPIERS